MRWIERVAQLEAEGKSFVLITILNVKGSSPRDTGTKMIVAGETSYLTIGGGHLEHKSIAIARDLLAKGEDGQHIEEFPLGPSLGQCCGGRVSVLFECFYANRLNIVVFGAGHVAQSLVPILAQMPVDILWVDSRPSQFPESISGNVEIRLSENPADEVSLMPANSYFIVMTHHHGQDYEISQSILGKNDFSYFGLIGSKTKWLKFQQRLKHRGIADTVIEKVHCPIGLPEVTGKRPVEVAVSIAAEIIKLYSEEKTSKAHLQAVTS